MIYKNSYQKLVVYNNADDTVVCVAHEDVKTIEKILDDELLKLQGYFCNNELVLNLKKGKTETAKRLKTNTKLVVCRN